VLHFLVDASLPGATAALIQAHGHASTDVRDIGLRSATDDEIAAHARANGMSLISGDFDFADIVRYPPADYNGLIVIEPPRKATRVIIVKLVEQFLNTPDVVAALPGRLVIVSAGRIRVRPPI
jgi:hypothetical protein